MKIEDILHSSPLLSVHKRVILNIMHTQNLLYDHFGEIVKQHGLSLEQFHVLEILRDLNTKSVNMHMIQEQMVTRTSNTTRLIDKLLDKGLVTRKICPADRRKTEITITGEGLLLFEKIKPALALYETELSGNLTCAELETLNSLLEKYRINLKK